LRTFDEQEEGTETKGNRKCLNGDERVECLFAVTTRVKELMTNELRFVSKASSVIQQQNELPEFPKDSRELSSRSAQIYKSIK